MVDDVDVTPRGGKACALLALLVLNRGRVIDADRLIDELWTDLPVDRARRAAQVRIAGLRKLLNAADAGCTLQFVEPGYRLTVVEADVDGDRFAALVAEARGHAELGFLGAASASFREALALWRGAPLLDVQMCLSVDVEATRLAQERSSVLEEYADVELACGRHYEWVASSKRWSPKSLFGSGGGLC